jgi:hypothetical protein
MPMHIRLRFACLTALLLALLSLPVVHAQSAPPPDSKTVSVVDGELGPCSADFTVTNNAGAPIYAASIKVHIAWGFMNARKLDLEVGTNAGGKARFIGLPSRTKQGLFFRASEGGREGSAFDDPAKTCKAAFTIVLEKKVPAAQIRARSERFSENPEVVDHRIAVASKLFWRMPPPSPMIIPISMRTVT